MSRSHSSAASDRPIIRQTEKPGALKPGSTIGVIAPASAPADRERFTRGCAYLEQLGYRLLHGRSSLKPHGYLSGTDEERLEELNRMLQLPDVDVLLCARGGYGTLRLLPNIDYEAAARTPKLLIGYSDITALQLALYHRLGLPGLSGPMITPDWAEVDRVTEEHFWPLVTSPEPQTIAAPNAPKVRTVQAGSTRGTLIGGNLTILTRLLGTPYLPNLEGTLLFLEDVGEPPYRIDGMLAQLQLAGILDEVNGMIFGRFTDRDSDTEQPSLSMEEVIRHYSRFVSGPVVMDFPYGHSLPLYTLPIGVQARMTVREEQLSIALLEGLVRSHNPA